MGTEHFCSSFPPAMASPPSTKGESVIVVMDASQSKGSADALDWALKNVVRPKDTVLVLGVMYELGKRPSCFPFHMGISFSGIWERLEFSGHSEKAQRELEEEIEKKREQYQTTLQPFYRQCKRNEVKLEVKIAAGYEPGTITVEEAQNFNTRWIVLDSHLRKEKVFIYTHVGCNVAVMKEKDVATLMPSKPTKATSIVAPAPPSNCRFPLSSRTGFPRKFSQTEIEEITNCFSEENIIQHDDNIKVYHGIFQDTPVIVKCFSLNDERFWTMVNILLRVRHRNIMNLVGHCCTDFSLFLLCDYPCMGVLDLNLQSDESAKNLTWKVRLNIALDIGGSLRYLHEESVDGPIAHLSVCSSSVVFSHDFSAILGNFTRSKKLKENLLCKCNEGSPPPCLNLDEDGHLLIDIHDYGVFLVELLSGKVATQFHTEGECQTLADWALPLLDTSLTEVMDPRLKDASDSKIAQDIACAALCCLRISSSAHKLSMSEVLAIVRGDQLAMSKP